MPPPPPPHRVLSAALKDIHNRGARLFNDGEFVAARRLFEGGLRMAGFLLHDFPVARAAARDALKEVDAAKGGEQLLAFRLHEAIDQVRLELKSAVDPRTATVSGTLVVGGQVAGGVCVLFYPPLGAAAASLAVTDPVGWFTTTTGLIPGDYHVSLVGRGIPDEYQAADTTPLSVHLAAGANAADFTVG